MTVYQLALATVMVAGSLVGGGILEILGTGRISIAGGIPVVAGYLAVFVLTSGMRLVSLFMLASIEPSGLRIRHRARRVLVWTIGAVPGMPGGEIEADVEDEG